MDRDRMALELDVAPRSSLSELTAPALPSRAVYLHDAKTQCALGDIDTYDDLLESLTIPAATSRAEMATFRQVRRATYTLKLPAFPPYRNGIQLPRPPLVSVTSIQYVDEAGDTQTWDDANYLVDAPAGPRCARGRIALAYGIDWPSTRCQMNAVTITFVCGYGAASAADLVTRPEHVPSLLRQAMLMDIATLFEHRENFVIGQSATPELPGASSAIYRSFMSYGG